MRKINEIYGGFIGNRNLVREEMVIYGNQKDIFLVKKTFSSN